MWVKLLVSALVFYAFIPGVLVTLRTPFTDANVTHAVLYGGHGQAHHDRAEAHHQGLILNSTLILILTIQTLRDNSPYSAGLHKTNPVWVRK
jgi:hypothetical protein